MKFVITLFLLSMGLLGCGTTKAYEGPSRSSDQVARLLAHGVRFHTVNGVSVSAFSSSVTVLPGKNVITLSTEPGSYTARDIENTELTIEFDAVAGTTYAVTGRRGEQRLCAFPINSESGDIDLTKPAGCLKARSTAVAPPPPS